MFCQVREKRKALCVLTYSFHYHPQAPFPWLCWEVTQGTTEHAVFSHFAFSSSRIILKSDDKSPVEVYPVTSVWVSQWFKTDFTTINTGQTSHHILVIDSHHEKTRTVMPTLFIRKAGVFLSSDLKFAHPSLHQSVWKVRAAFSPAG